MGPDSIFPYRIRSYWCVSALIAALLVATNVCRADTPGAPPTTSGSPLDDCKPRLNVVYAYDGQWMNDNEVRAELHHTLRSAQASVSLLEKQFSNHGYDIPGFSSEQIRTYAFDSGQGWLTEIDIRNGVNNAVVGNSYYLGTNNLTQYNGFSYLGTRFSSLSYDQLPLKVSFHDAVLNAIEQDKRAAGQGWFDNDVVIYAVGQLTGNAPEEPHSIAYPSSGQIFVATRYRRPAPGELPENQKLHELVQPYYVNKSAGSKRSHQDLGVAILHQVLHTFGLGHVEQDLMHFSFADDYTMYKFATEKSVLLTASQSATVLAKMCGIPEELRNKHGANPYFTGASKHECTGGQVAIHSTVVDPFVVGNAAGSYAGIRAGLDLDTLPIGLGAGKPYPYVASPAGGSDQRLCVSGESGAKYIAYRLPAQFEKGRLMMQNYSDVVTIAAPASGSTFGTYEIIIVEPSQVDAMLENDHVTSPITQEQYLEAIWKAGTKITFRAAAGARLVLNTSNAFSVGNSFVRTVTLITPDNTRYKLLSSMVPPEYGDDIEKFPVLIMQEELAAGQLNGNGYFAP